MSTDKTCIAECMECHRVCMETLTHCFSEGKSYVEATHLQLLLDCSQICQTATDFMIRQSDLVCRTCEIAAYVCEKTSVSCERWASSDPQMKRCMEVCSRCGECCRKVMMAG